jgi:hypothetical protein
MTCALDQESTRVETNDVLERITFEITESSWSSSPQAVPLVTG